MLIPSRPGFTIEEQDNVVEFDAETQTRITVDVRVPVNTSLRLSSANAGNMAVQGVNGTHELSNANGGVSAKDVSGSVVAETANGSVEVISVAVTPDTPRRPGLVREEFFSHNLAVSANNEIRIWLKIPSWYTVSTCIKR